MATNLFHVYSTLKQENSTIYSSIKTPLSRTRLRKVVVISHFQKQSIQAQVASESAHELDEIQRAIAAESQSSRGSASIGNGGASVVGGGAAPVQVTMLCFPSVHATCCGGYGYANTSESDLYSCKKF